MLFPGKIPCLRMSDATAQPSLDLAFEIDAASLSGLGLQTAGGWFRRTTVVALEGGGHVGYGEDVTYASDEQESFQQRGAPEGLVGHHTLASFSDRLRALPATTWFPEAPQQEASYHYRRWAFESAALDLALKTHGLSLGAWLEREPEPVRFVASVGLGNPPDLARLHERLFHIPDLRFKLDWDQDWDESFLDALRALDVVDVVDFKGHYHGAFAGPEPEPTGYAIVAEQLPHALLEDPAWTADCAQVLEPHHARVTWDAPLHRMRDLEGLPFLPKVINLKPSRFATVPRFLQVLAWMRQHGVAGYGGGQFELGPGRDQIQHLASLCYPEGPNDVAPVAYHEFDPSDPPPGSPLPAFTAVEGFGGWTP